MKFIEAHLKSLHECPWCHSKSFEKWGNDVHNVPIVKCTNCDLIYSKKILNGIGQKEYWKNYLSNIHISDKNLVEKREIVYKLEFDFINKFFKNKYSKSVLDIGCSGGYFLNFFEREDFDCFGVEFGEEAAKEASEKFKVWLGEFSDLKIDRKFDLIVFRGVLQYIQNPIEYLDKAISLLNKNGIVYITSTPNTNSLCCKLFKDKWNMAIGPVNCIGYNQKHFDEYFESKYFEKVIEHTFYTETPYANVEEDILKVAEAIKLIKENKPIDFYSPSFWGNMITLGYRKII